jgi:hypothetical protein
MEALFHKPVVCPVLIDRVNELATLHALIDQVEEGGWSCCPVKQALANRGW